MLATEADPSRCAWPSRRWAGTPSRAPGWSRRRTCRWRWAATVEVVATVAVPPHVPYALDADVADEVYVAGRRADRRDGRRAARLGGPDPAPVRRRGSPVEVSARRTPRFDAAVLAVSAQLLGAGERVLADSVAYVKQRRQFGREIG